MFVGIILMIENFLKSSRRLLIFKEVLYYAHGYSFECQNIVRIKSVINRSDSCQVVEVLICSEFQSVLNLLLNKGTIRSTVLIIIMYRFTTMITQYLATPGFLLTTDNLAT